VRRVVFLYSSTLSPLFHDLCKVLVGYLLGWFKLPIQHDEWEQHVGRFEFSSNLGLVELEPFLKISVHLHLGHLVLLVDVVCAGL